MPWVRSHRRRVPNGWFRTTTVRSHHRSRPGLSIVNIAIGVVVAVVIILLLIVLF